MPIKFSAIVPHPPILIPSIGKDNILRLEKTRNSFDRIMEALGEEKIETIVIISSHGPIRPEVFSVNISDEFEINFEEFGDFSVKMNIGGDLELAQSIREELIERADVQAINQPLLDHGCGVPVYSLLSVRAGLDTPNKNAKNIELVPIYASGASLKEHFELGKIIARPLKRSRKKIAVFASGDLSHTVAKNSPAGYSPRGAKFDQKLIERLQENNSGEILNFENDFIAAAKPCGLKAIAMLLGILGEIDFEISSTSYEAPFGIGHLTMIMKTIPT